MNRKQAEHLLRQLKTGALDRREFVARAASLGLGWSAIGTLLLSCTRKDGRGTSADSSSADAADLGPMETELSI